MAPSTTQTIILPIPLGNPMNDAGTQRNAPSQWVSLWAGIRPTTDFNPFDVAGTVTVFVEAGLIPYVDTKRPSARGARPLFVPFAEAFSVVNGNQPNILGQRTLLPWPPGGLVVRISFDWAMMQMLGTEVDFVAAWAVNSLPAWASLPALEDSKDLVR